MPAPANQALSKLAVELPDTLSVTATWPAVSPQNTKLGQLERGQRLLRAAGRHGTQFYRDYARVISAMDREIGRILDELDRLGIADNTVVAYAGDNGFFWGEKQLIDKRWLYEESTRIPFLMRYPAGLKHPGRVADDLVLNVDLAPTLLHLAGLPVPEAMQGKSLVPLLADQNPSLRKSFHLEYFKDFPYGVPEQDAVRTDRYLYIQYQGRKTPELRSLSSISNHILESAL